MLATPNGIRTRVHGLKGRCPNHWTIGSGKPRAWMPRKVEYVTIPLSSKRKFSSVAATMPRSVARHRDERSVARKLPRRVACVPSRRAAGDRRRRAAPRRQEFAGWHPPPAGSASGRRSSPCAAHNDGPADAYRLGGILSANHSQTLADENQVAAAYQSFSSPVVSRIRTSVGDETSADGSAVTTARKLVRRRTTSPSGCSSSMIAAVRSTWRGASSKTKVGWVCLNAK